jgi:hypothetical protein
MLKKAPDTTRLEKAIEELENAIIAGDPETERYTKMVSSLDLLYKLRSGHKPSKTELKDWIPLIGSIGGILVIVIFEAFGHALTSKSVGFVFKPKS